MATLEDFEEYEASGDFGGVGDETVRYTGKTGTGWSIGVSGSPSTAPFIMDYGDLIAVPDVMIPPLPHGGGGNNYLFFGAFQTSHTLTTEIDTGDGLGCWWLSSWPVAGTSQTFSITWFGNPEFGGIRVVNGPGDSLVVTEWYDDGDNYFETDTETTSPAGGGGDTFHWLWADIMLRRGEGWSVSNPGGSVIVAGDYDWTIPPNVFWRSQFTSNGALHAVDNIYGWPTSTTAPAVRLYPRDDGRGMSSAPRIWPMPKSNRIIGGYQ